MANKTKWALSVALPSKGRELPGLMIASLTPKEQWKRTTMSLMDARSTSLLNILALQNGIWWLASTPFRCSLVLACVLS